MDFLKVLVYFLLLTRIEDKIYQFWKESDFGYVKSVQDNLQFVCKPNENEVRSLNFVNLKVLNLSRCIIILMSELEKHQDIDSYYM